MRVQDPVGVGPARVDVDDDRAEFGRTVLAERQPGDPACLLHGVEVLVVRPGRFDVHHRAVVPRQVGLEHVVRVPDEALRQRDAAATADSGEHDAADL
ncbi:MAG: hypothetical protein GEU86_09990 [Actinophytocola sp.]|nr:hypothetical protein [Actinophytocola sp.]